MFNEILHQTEPYCPLPQDRPISTTPLRDCTGRHFVTIDQWNNPSSPFPIGRLSTFNSVYICVLLCAGVAMESVKSDPNHFDVQKICRTCLREKGEMRSVFVADESTGQAVIVAEMIMGFTSVQVIFLFVYFLLKHARDTC